MPVTNAYDRIFRSPEASIFDAQSQLAAMLAVEAALARVQGRLGVIPREAAEIIATHCSPELVDLESVIAPSADSGNLAIPLVKRLIIAVGADSSQAAGYVHWGATSQDILDTAFVLQLRSHLKALTAKLDALCRACAQLAEEHAQTVMSGRTWLQQAVPVTFGLKAAGWLDAMLRHRVRLRELRARVVVLQFGGASGTLASLGNRGVAVAEALAAELDLALPAMPWHAHRDRLAEVASFHGLLAGTLGKIGRDISLCSQTEIAELSEPTVAGRGGSSTMPHKRNPVGSAVLLAAAVRVPGLVSTVLTAMVQEHERGLGGWQSEWETLPELCSLTLGALQRALEIVPALVVGADAMRRNLDASAGLSMAEAVSMRLAEVVGRDRAHSLVETAAHASREQNIPLLEALLAAPEVNSHLDRTTVAGLLDPNNYLGSSSAFIHSVLAEYHNAFRHTSEVD